jgi:hypothetical protein
MLQTEFCAWLSRICVEEKPSESVIAYNIGLFETPDGFSAYLIGADTFDKNSNDWACDEAFTPKERYFSISREQVDGWKNFETVIIEATKNFLWSPDGEKTFLAKAVAITVGFDDGNLKRVL